MDDRPDELEVTVATLRAVDYEIVTAASSAEALAQPSFEDFAVVVLDLDLLARDASGQADAFRRRASAEALPVIVLSRDALDEGVRTRAFELGATDCLPKPPGAAALIGKVEVLVRLTLQARAILAATRRERDWLAVHLDIKRRTIDSAPIGIGFATLADTWLHVNPALAEIAGLPAEEIAVRSLRDLVHRDDVARLAQTLDDVAAGAVARSRGEYRIVRPDGAEVWAAITVSLAQGDEPCRVTLVEDISERKAIEDERAQLLRQLEDGTRSRDNFLSLAAHELRHPLTPLLVQVTNLRGLAAQQGPQFPRELWIWLERQLQPVERSVHRLKNLIETLLDVSRMTVGRHRLALEELDLSAITREVVEEMRGDGERNGSALELRAEAPVVGRWDRSCVERMLGHLLSNAIKFGCRRPIEIEVSGDEGWGRVSVRDHGVGIAEADRARIFDRFERGASIRHFGGFGLGLWIVRELLDTHAGRLQLWSELGRGSRFTLELPRQPPSSIPPASPTS